jgi:hypothetical protein
MIEDEDVSVEELQFETPIDLCHRLISECEGDHTKLNTIAIT